MAGSIVSGAISLIKQAGVSKEVTENAVNKENKKKATLKSVGKGLIVLTILAALITGVLGYLGIFPITVNGAHVSGLGGALASAFYTVVGVIIFIVAPIIALVGVVMTITFTWVGIIEIGYVDTSETTGNIARVLAKVVGRVLVRVVLPVITVIGANVFLSLLLSQAIGAGLNVIINLFWQDRKKPYIAYLFALIDACIAGYDGSLLSWVSGLITAIKPAWTSGIIGLGIVLAIFTFFTGVWSIFSNKK